MSKRRSLAAAVLLTSLAWLVIAGGGVWVWRRPQPVAFQLQPPPATHTPAPTATPAPLSVEVAGAVHRPGVYALPAGARSGDALAAAGGPAPNADADAVDLARAVQDGEKLVVPTARPMQSADAAGPGIEPELAAVRSADNDPNAAGAIDINTASAQELEALPAIGPVTAQAIVDYRSANGPFPSVEELLKVKGVGPATLEKIRMLVAVGQ